MKNFDKLSNNKHRIDLISLKEFLFKKGDDTIENLIIKNRFIKRGVITREYFENNVIQIFDNYNPGAYDFVGNDFPVEWYSEYVILLLRNQFYLTRSLLYLNSGIKDYYKYCEEGVSISGDALKYIDSRYIDYSLSEKAVKNNGTSLGYVPDNLKDYNLCYLAVSKYIYALVYVPKDIENYYDLVKIAFEKSPDIVNEDWFPREYISRLIEDFPEDAEGLKTYLLKEGKSLLKEYYLNDIEDAEEVNEIDLFALRDFLLEHGDVFLTILTSVDNLRNIKQETFNKCYIGLFKYHIDTLNNEDVMNGSFIEEDEFFNLGDVIPKKYYTKEIIENAINTFGYDDSSTFLINKTVLKNYKNISLKEYISKEVKKLLKENLFPKGLNNF